MRNIILIGFMGTGKTTIAAKLSHRLGMKYVSTDDLIVEREKRTINEIFTKSGEEYFRDVESDVVRELSSREGLIIDCGGGVVLRDANIAMLKSSGMLVCLAAKPEVVMERTRKYKHRPLLNVDDPKRKIMELLNKRAGQYAKADHTFDTGDLTINQVIDRIAELACPSGDKEKA